MQDDTYQSGELDAGMPIQSLSVEQPQQQVELEQPTSGSNPALLEVEESAEDTLILKAVQEEPELDYVEKQFNKAMIIIYIAVGVIVLSIVIAIIICYVKGYCKNDQVKEETS